MATIRILLGWVLLSATCLAQPGTFDTAPLRTAVTEESNFRTNLLDGSLFDRTRRPFSLGWNFSPLETRYGSQALGFTSIDNNMFFEGSGGAPEEDVTNSAPDTRFVIVEGHQQDMFLLFQGAQVS
jgi:hypothetical protein